YNSGLRSSEGATEAEYERWAADQVRGVLSAVSGDFFSPPRPGPRAHVRVFFSAPAFPPQTGDPESSALRHDPRVETVGAAIRGVRKALAELEAAGKEEWLRLVQGMALYAHTDGSGADGYASYERDWAAWNRELGLPLFEPPSGGGDDDPVAGDPGEGSRAGDGDEGSRGGSGDRPDRGTDRVGDGTGRADSGSAAPGEAGAVACVPVASSGVKDADHDGLQLCGTILPAAETQRLLTGIRLPEGLQPLGSGFELWLEGDAGAAAPRPAVIDGVGLELQADLLVGADPERVGVYRVGIDGSLEKTCMGWAGDRLVIYPRGLGRFILAQRSVTFADLTGHWAAPEIERVAAQGVVTGMPGGRFLPQGWVTRAQLAAMLVRAKCLPPAPRAAIFRDVAAADWFAGEVGAAAEAGIVKGFPDGTFRPHQPATREEVAAMLVRALTPEAASPGGSPGEAHQGLLSRYADVDRVSPWALPYLAAAVRTGLVTGRGETVLAPDQLTTRAEAAVLMARIWRHGRPGNGRGWSETVSVLRLPAR
ncbi:MAG TPA: S-layer homology domain-containing protein, partial [Gemmataceae bacterium]